MLMAVNDGGSHPPAQFVDGARMLVRQTTAGSAIAKESPRGSRQARTPSVAASDAGQGCSSLTLGVLPALSAIKAA
jgi:hypothetical protein